MNLAAKREATMSDVASPARDEKGPKVEKTSPLESLCWALLSSNEFLYLN